MEVDLASAVRFMPLDAFVLAHPCLFLVGELPRAHSAVVTGTPFAAKLRKRQAGFESLVAVGRGDGCDIVIPDFTVSRLHAMFRLREDGLELSDSGSRNGTRADNVVLTGRATAKIVAGTRTRFGSVELVVADARAAWEVLRRAPRRAG